MRSVRPIPGFFYRYAGLAQLFHWVTAIAVIGMLIAGFIMTDMPVSADKVKLYGIHKALGALLLGVTLLRMFYRFFSASPPLTLEGSGAKYVRAAAKAGHLALYAMLVLMPLTGWAMSSASGFPVSVFGWFLLPDIAPQSAELAQTLSSVHEIGAFVFCGLIGVHVAAVIFHMAVIKDKLLFRMLPGKRGCAIK